MPSEDIKKTVEINSSTSATPVTDTALAASTTGVSSEWTRVIPEPV
jgi:hypothetical protein